MTYTSLSLKTIVKLQTNNLFNIGIEIFIKKKETKTIKVEFKTKTWIILKTGASENFNIYHMIIEAQFIIVIQKN